MTIRLRTAFFISLGVFVFWFLYIERAILTPFLLAGLFAYLINPVVTFVSKQTKLSRSFVGIVVYLGLIVLVIYLGALLTKRIIDESADIRVYVTTLLATARSQINSLPDWLRPTVYDLLFSLRKITLAGPFSFAPFFPQAISRIISFIIFLVSGFYFVKEGGDFFQNMFSIVPKEFRLDLEILLRRINTVLRGYLRGQIFLVFLMVVWTFIALSVIGVRFALLIALFTGFAEIVPVIGPIVAALLAATVALVTGTSNFNLPSINTALIVLLVYFILRHLEDYFVIPFVMGKITKLPPIVILFAVIAGGHLLGVLGLILAVPTAAIIRLLLEFFLDQINHRHHLAPGSE